VLKANSLQGVLVFGRREKRVSWGAEELIAKLLVSLSKHVIGVESFSARCSAVVLGAAKVDQTSVYYQNLHGKGHSAGDFGSLSG
jgi:hypothetical protein